MFPYKRFGGSILAAATSTTRYVPTDENMYRAHFWLHLWYRRILHLSGVLPDLYSARSFISPPAGFQILNSLCDTLIFLVLEFGRYSSAISFCICLFGIELSTFFGIARQFFTRRVPQDGSTHHGPATHLRVWSSQR